MTSEFQLTRNTKAHSRRIREFARLHGADLVGIAPVSRFKNAPVGFHPKNIMSGVRSVIVIGMRFPLGLLQAKCKAATTKAYEIVFHRLDHCAYELSLFIEELGGKAVPVPADSPYEFWDAARQEGRGTLSHRHAAVLAGLGNLGKNGILITPEFGNRVNLASIMTDLPLQGDPLFLRKLCISSCEKCIEVCPSNAIGKDGTVDQEKCRRFHSTTTSRGFRLFACWECRGVCPVKTTLTHKRRGKRRNN